MLQFRYLLVLILVTVSYNVFAFDTWHTVGGKHYDVYTSARVEKDGRIYYVVSYRSDIKLKNKKKLKKEFNDLLSHLHYFYLTKKEKGDSNSFATIEAFNHVPKSEKDTGPSVRYSQKLSELGKIAKTNKWTDSNRLKAFREYNNKNWQKAAIAFKKIKKRVPHDYQQTANAYLMQQKKDRAVRQLQIGLSKYKNDVNLLNNLAMATMFMGSFVFEGTHEYDPEVMAEAKKILLKAIRKDRNNWLTKSNMAVLEMRLENFPAAEKLYEEAIALSAGAADAHYRFGSFYHVRKNWARAKKQYRMALKKAGKNRSPASESLKNKINKRLRLVKQKKTP